jgi:hypothetical protein
MLFVCVGVLVLFTGACTIFALVVTAAQALQENAQKSWPEVTARVDTCRFERSSINGRHQLYIGCRFLYAVGGEQNAINIYSARFPGPEVAQYPRNQMQPFEAWLDAHPPGTPVALRYDPANHKKALIPSDFMPRGGPHTPNNLRILAACVAGLVVTLLIVRLAGQRADRAP